MTLTTRQHTPANAQLLCTTTQHIIARAAEEQWPNKEVVLGPECPSVTSYVCRVTVDGEELIAKYSWLGMSLVSILRGVGGTWEEVQHAQSEYVASADLLTAREAQNLRLLRRLGRPQVCETASLSRGVLFTHKVAGTPLADELVARPWEADALLDAAFSALGQLHGPAGALYLRGAASITERSVVGVFRRKFNGVGAAAYLRELGRCRGLPDDERQEVAELFQTSVRRLIQLASAISVRRDIAVYGDLKPEHVYIDGPRLLYVDPAVQWAAGPQPDLAKLAGRSVLLALGYPDDTAGRQIVQGAASVLARHVAAMSVADRAVRLREVMVLMLMDTVSILSTCLSAPPDLPLTVHQQSLITQARRIARIVDRGSALLFGSMAGPRLLDAIFAEVEHTAGSPR